MANMFAGAGQQGAVPFNPTPGASSRIRRLDLSIEDAGSCLRLRLRGRLDCGSAASAHDTIVASAASGRRVHLDLSGVDAATRAGCRAIFVAAKLLHGRGGRITIIGARPNVRLVLGKAGFDAVIEFRDGVASPDAAEPAARRPTPGPHRAAA
jgi:anti-anti-sigma factor